MNNDSKKDIIDLFLLSANVTTTLYNEKPPETQVRRAVLLSIIASHADRESDIFF